jgi:ribosomal protein S18 acetylase RimI-like enzyme
MPKAKKTIIIGENSVKKRDIPSINLLLKQLSPAFKGTNHAYIKKVMDGGVIFIARDGKKPVGMAVLIFMRKPTAFGGNCENVIVDNNYRGLGIGRKLMERLLKRAKTLKMKYVDLTSRPERETANRLYSELGFRKKETNCLRKHI